MRLTGYMSHNQDQRCIEKVLAGDTRAFASLIERYKHMVFTLVLKILKSREDAEEVSQDVFMKAYKALGTFKGDSKFSTWLYKIAYYTSLDQLKKNERTVEISSYDISQEYSIASLDTALDNLEATERKVMIKGAMDQLIPDDHIIIILFYFEELSLKEISKVMGITANNAKVRLFRSRERLADLLKNTIEPEMICNYGRK